MSGMLLSCADFPIIKQVADLLGFVMNILYTIFDKIGIANIGLCIIVFTLIIKLLMIPMTIKQQKTTKLSSLMSPELQAIRKKYAGKNDNASMMAMNNETRAVYEKYKESYPESWARKVIWAYEKLMKEKNGNIYWSDIRKISGVKKHNFETIVPYLKKYTDEKTANIIISMVS